MTEQILWNFQIPRNLGGSEHVQTVYQDLFPPPTHKSLGTRLVIHQSGFYTCLVVMVNRSTKPHPTLSSLST